MQTFKLNASQVQNYFTIRIFGIIHLLGAAGLAIFLDGPRDGIGPIAIGVTLATAPMLAYWGLRLLQAAVGKRIFGHFVLTDQTLAIKRPGRARQFISRRDCIGYIPDPWTLCLRGRRHCSLKFPGMENVLLEQVGSALVRSWWPRFEKEVGRNLVNAVTKLTPHEVRVDFRATGDTPLPHLVFRRKQGAGRTMTAHGIPLIGMYLLFSPAYWNQLLGRSPIVSPLGHSFLLNSAQALLFVLLFAYWLLLIRNAARQHFSCTYYVLSRRGLALLTPGHDRAILRPGEFAQYAPFSGALQTRDGREFNLAGVLSCRPPLTRMIYCALSYWEQPIDPSIERGVQNERSLGWEIYILLPILWLDNGALAERLFTPHFWTMLVLLISIGLVWIGHHFHARNTL